MTGCKPLEYNREVYDWFLGQLPVKGVQSHAAVSGEMFYVLNLKLRERVPKFDTSKLRFDLYTELPPGRVKFTSRQEGSQIATISVIYGPITEAMTGAFSAQVVEDDIEKLKEVGAAIWNALYKTKEIITVEFSVKK